MGKAQWGRSGGDSAHSALIIGGIAIALGGAALFGMVAHTWTPFLPQKGAGASPFDTVARAGSTSPARSTELIPRRSRLSTIPFEPRTDEFAPEPARAAAPPESLTNRESVVVHEAPEAVRVVETATLEADPRPLVSAIALIEPPPIEMRPAEPTRVEPRAVVIRVADVSVIASSGAKSAQTELRIVQSGLKPAPPRVAEAKPLRSKPAEAKPAAPRAAEAKTARRPAEAKPLAVKVAEAKPAPRKVAETRRVEPKPAALRVAAVRSLETPRGGFKRVSETKAADAKRSEARRLAEMKAVEERFAETKRALETKAAEARLAEARHAAELKSAEAKLADSQRAFETQAAEARLAETKRAVDATLAEAKLAEANLAETKRAVETTLAQARSAEVRPAVENRPQLSSRTAPAQPRYEWCDNCGTVSSVVNRYRDRGNNNWEVRVSFPDGADRVFLFPTDPGFSSGERVRFEAGRLMRHYSRRTAA